MAVDTLARAMIAEVITNGGGGPGPSPGGNYISREEVMQLLQGYVPLAEFNELVASVEALQQQVDNLTAELNLGTKALYLVEDTASAKKRG